MDQTTKIIVRTETIVTPETLVSAILLLFDFDLESTEEKQRFKVEISLCIMAYIDPTLWGGDGLYEEEVAMLRDVPAVLGSTKLATTYYDLDYTETGGQPLQLQVVIKFLNDHNSLI